MKTKNHICLGQFPLSNAGRMQDFAHDMGLDFVIFPNKISVFNNEYEQTPYKDSYLAEGNVWVVAKNVNDLSEFWERYEIKSRTN